MLIKRYFLLPMLASGVGFYAFFFLVRSQQRQETDSVANNL
jgi:hypothetical protein